MIKTFTGKLVDPLNPKESDIVLEDIVTALSRMCRFGGHTSKYYTVLHHSINCLLEARYRNLDLATQRYCFCHDFSEAYVSDVVQPVKKHLQKYYDIEQTIQDCIYSRFSVSGDMFQMKQVDLDMAVYEGRLLMSCKAADFRWRKPSVENCCPTVLSRLTNIPSVETSISEFKLICNLLEIN